MSHLFDQGGFMPNGFGAVIAAVLITMFSFMGTEIVTIAAAESPRPAEQHRPCDPLGDLADLRCSTSARSSRRRARAVERARGSPRPARTRRLWTMFGIPGAKAIVDLVVLVAVASCLNSALYTASRMIFSLGERGDAPPAVMRTYGERCSDRVAVLASTVVGFIAVIAQLRVARSEVFSSACSRRRVRSHCSSTS